MNGNQGGLDLFGEQLPQGERPSSSEPSPEDFLFSQQPPAGSMDSAALLTTTTTPSFGMPLGRYSMPDPAPGQEQKPAPRPVAPQPREALGRRAPGPGAPSAVPQGAEAPAKQSARRAPVPVRRVEAQPARRERPMLPSLLLVGVVLTTSLGFASWIATEFGEYVLGGLAAVMGLVGSAFTWVLSRN
ncbi:MAG: hypothetical protein RIT25_2760 [Planctomycetota bacterium]